MLKIENLTYRFTHQEPILKNISFSINKGESLRLDGDNGTGKTTLLNCISRFYKIESGDILIDGKSILKKRTHQLWNIGIRRTFSDRLVYDHLTIEEQLLLTHKKDELPKLLEKVPYLYSILKRDGIFLSGGEKMLVALSAIINTNAKVLLLDEPFNGLSETNINHIINILIDIKNSGTSILIVDHQNNFKTDNVYKINTNKIQKEIFY